MFFKKQGLAISHTVLAALACGGLFVSPVASAQMDEPSEQRHRINLNDVEDTKESQLATALHRTGTFRLPRLPVPVPHNPVPSSESVHGGLR